MVRGPAPGPPGRGPRGPREGGMEVLGWPAPLAVAAGSATGDSRVAVDVTPTPYAGSPRVLESPSPALWQVVPVRHRPASPFAVTPAPASGKRPAAPRGHRGQKKPKSTRPGAIFGDPGGSILCPKVPSPHWAHSHLGDPGGNITPKVSTRAVVVWDTGRGPGLALSGSPPSARSSLLASISGCGGKYGAAASAGAESEAV